jgi:hypothetical protein
MSAAPDVVPGTPVPPVHTEHVWELRAVEFDEAVSVQRFECRTCGDVRFA